MSSSESDEEFHDFNPCRVSNTLPTSSTVKNPLHRAILEDDVEAVMNYVKQNPYKVNLGDSTGATCLHWAARAGSLKSLQYILSLKQIRVNLQTHDGSTALMEALKYTSSYEVVALLVKHKCSVTKRNNREETPLHLASVCRYDSTKIGQLLIKKGADVNAIDWQGITPLHEACSYDNIEFVCMLLYYNANVNVFTYYCTPFHIALQKYSNDLIQCLYYYIDDFRQFNKADIYILVQIAIDAKMPILYDIIDKIEPTIIFPTPLSTTFIDTEESVKWVWFLLSKGIEISLLEMGRFYKHKGFCEEIKIILTSEMPIAYSPLCNPFVQKIVFNICIRDNLVCDTYFIKPENVPSLTQIARDNIRQFIFNKYQNDVNFRAYNIIMGMNISQVLKDILLLKRPIYINST